MLKWDICLKKGDFLRNFVEQQTKKAKSYENKIQITDMEYR